MLPIQAIERVVSGEMAEAAEEEGGNSSGGRLSEDITLLPPGCHPVLEYAVKPSSVIVLVGPIKLERYYCNKNPGVGVVGNCSEGGHSNGGRLSEDITLLPPGCHPVLSMSSNHLVS